jgi:hypothetical protein
MEGLPPASRRSLAKDGPAHPGQGFAAAGSIILPAPVRPAGVSACRQEAFRTSAAADAADLLLEGEIGIVSTASTSGVAIPAPGLYVPPSPLLRLPGRLLHHAARCMT